MRRPRLQVVVGVAAAALLSICSITPANAANNLRNSPTEISAVNVTYTTGGSLRALTGEIDVSDVDEEQFDWFVENGVPPETARLLIAQYNAGIELDSMSGANPVEIATSEVDGWNVTRAEYEDGSISVSKIETPVASESGTDISPRGVSGCTSSSGGSGYIAYYNCAVVGSNGAWLSIEFRADYTRLSNGAGIISNLASPYAHAFGGTATTPVLSILTPTGTPAHATATTTFNGPPPQGSKTCRLHLYVNGATAYTENQNF